MHSSSYKKEKRCHKKTKIKRLFKRSKLEMGAVVHICNEHGTRVHLHS